MVEGGREGSVGKWKGDKRGMRSVGGRGKGVWEREGSSGRWKGEGRVKEEVEGRGRRKQEKGKEVERSKI